MVVKVQRPRIETIVETDLRAIQTATRWLKRYRPIRRRVDLDRLYDEFSRTTRTELDFVAEGENAERFADDFADDPGVRIPRIYAETSTRRVLIMENVASIKITDFEAIEAAGISRQEVARRLFDTYLEQVFVHNFVHADPHPGNLFVQPLRRSRPTSALRRRAGQALPPGLCRFWHGRHRPRADAPALSRLSAGLCHPGRGAHGARLPGAGVLLPGADLARLEQIEAELLDRYWGLTLREAQQLAMNEWHNLAHEYRDILYEMPFQLPTDLLFVGRAMAILFGMATSLDPDFDPWQAIEPFARQMAGGEVQRDWRGVLDGLAQAARLLLSLPGQADRFFSQALRGELAVRTAWTPDAMRTVRRVETAVNRLAAAVVFAALLLAAVAVYVTQGEGGLSYGLFALAAVALLVTLTRR